MVGTAYRGGIAMLPILLMLPILPRLVPPIMAGLYAMRTLIWSCTCTHAQHGRWKGGWHGGNYTGVV